MPRRARKTAYPLRDFCRDDSGPTAVEYALIAGAVALVIVGVVFLLGGQVQALYQQILGAFG